MNNSTTNYQTSFKVSDTDGKAFIRLKQSVYGWILKRENDKVLRDKKRDFFFRCEWIELFQTNSIITTDTYLNEADGDAWAIRYTHEDRTHGRARFWFSDIGFKQMTGFVVVSVRISHAWNTEYLNKEPEPPKPSVPNVIHYILAENKVFSGRKEFRLATKPIRFSKVGEGIVLCTFIQSPERRYPLIVFNGDSSEQVREADQLAIQLAGKCQVVMIAENQELIEEIQNYLPKDYWVEHDRLRVYFPFTHRNTPSRHRYYNVHWHDYLQKRQGMVNGLLRHNNKVEDGAVESVEDIKRLVSREKLLRLKDSTPEHKKELAEFYELLNLVEKERDQLKIDADQLKNDAAAFASEADEQHEEAEKQKAEATRLKYECNALKEKIAKMTDEGATLQMSKLLPSLPTCIYDVANAAVRCFPRLVITDRALKAAQEYSECKSLNEAWEILRHLNDTMYRLKYEQGVTELEKSFLHETSYELAMTEGPNTKKDKKLMDLRKLQYNGQAYEITPHIKYEVREPKLVRIYFAFDEGAKKIIVGHIGKHIPNATTKTM